VLVRVEEENLENDVNIFSGKSRVRRRFGKRHLDNWYLGERQTNNRHLDNRRLVIRQIGIFKIRLQNSDSSLSLSHLGPICRTAKCRLARCLERGLSSRQRQERTFSAFLRSLEMLFVARMEIFESRSRPTNDNA